MHEQERPPKMTTWEITLDRKFIFAQDFASKVFVLKHIFPKNFMKIDQETAEKIVATTRENNDYN